MTLDWNKISLIVMNNSTEENLFVSSLYPTYDEDSMVIIQFSLDNSTTATPSDIATSSDLPAEGTELTLVVQYNGELMTSTIIDVEVYNSGTMLLAYKPEEE